MDWQYYTNLGDVLKSIDPRLFPPFILGIIYGGAVATGVTLKWWWLVVLIVLLPVLLFVTSALLPLGDNVTYRLFFMGVIVLACGGLSYYVAR